MATGTSSAERYLPDRDQLSVVTAVILLAYALGRLANLPTRLVTVESLGVVFEFRVSGPVLILVVVAALISAGADMLIRSHPRLRARAMPLQTVVHWILPGTAALGLGLVLNTSQLADIWWLGLLLSALLLVVVLVAEYTVVFPDDAGYGPASLGLSVLTYVVALGLFTWLSFIGARSSLAAGSTAFVAGLFSLRLLVLRFGLGTRTLVGSLVVGLLVGQVMWAMNYWPAAPLGTGIVLLVVFYTAHGVTQQHIADRLTPRVLIEYVLLALIGLVAALAFALRS